MIYHSSKSKLLHFYLSEKIPITCCSKYMIKYRECQTDRIGPKQVNAQSDVNMNYYGDHFDSDKINLDLMYSSWINQ